MNHRTPAEDFRATLAAMSRPQLEEAMRYLRNFTPEGMRRALAFAAMDPVINAEAVQAALHATVADLALPDVELAEQAEIAHISVGDIAAVNPLSVDCPDCGAAEGDRCWTAFGCMARYNAAQVAS